MKNLYPESTTNETTNRRVFTEDETYGNSLNFEMTKKSPRDSLNLVTLGMTAFEGENKLNKHLLAYVRLYEPTADDPYQVCAILEDGEFGLENQYSTPFENSNPEGRMPNLMGMIQSGQMITSINDVMNIGSNSSSILTDNQGADSPQDQGVLGQLFDKLEGLKGHSTFTKLNSEQIYTSSNSVKISGTLVLSAWINANLEVEKALQKLQEWATPKYLADKSALMSGLQQKSLEGFFPSLIPPAVSLVYGGKTYGPLVIESLSAPITAPMTADGSRIAVKCQVTFSSQKAWDKGDIIKLYG